MFFYFRRIKVKGIENIPENQPVLLLSNHQNALLDALLIATSIKGYAHYLTRASVFNSRFVSSILKGLQLLPVYRIRDGYTNLTNNNAIFQRATDLLEANETVTIFPEGSHNLARRVRPLSKGFTRIVFSVLNKNPESELKLVPIGVNYNSPKTCPDSAAIYFGTPIKAKTYLCDNKHESVVNLKTDVHSAISRLTTHIPLENYEETLSKLNSINVDFLDPKGTNAFISSHFEDCKPKDKKNFNGLRSILKYLLILNLLIPYAVWKLLVQPRIIEHEFTSTFRFAIAATLVPIYLLMAGVILTAVFSFKVAILFVVGILALALAAIKL